MSSIYEMKKEFLKVLKQDAYCRGKVILSSGKESDYYIDARRVTLNPRGVNLCAKIILDMIKDDKIDAIGGPTLGADPIVGAIAALSYESGHPLNAFIVRKAPKPYGKQRQVEGPLLKENARVVLLDDVATTGKSILESMEVLKAMNVKVVKALCLVDRQEGAQENLLKAGCPLVSIFSLKDILE